MAFGACLPWPTPAAQPAGRPGSSPTPLVTATAASGLAADGPSPTALAAPQATATPGTLAGWLGLAVADTVEMTVRPLPDAEEAIRAVSFATTTRGWMARGKTVLTTFDGGQQWRRQADLDGSITHLSFLSPRLGWAVVEGRLFATRDGGAAWQPVGEAFPFPVTRADFLDPLYGFAGGEHGLLRTADGGRTWAALDVPCPERMFFGSFSFISTDIGWVNCGGQPATAMQYKLLYKTTDGGQTWALLAETPTSPDLARAPGVLPWSGRVPWCTIAWRRSCRPRLVDFGSMQLMRCTGVAHLNPRGEARSEDRIALETWLR